MLFAPQPYDQDRATVDVPRRVETAALGAVASDDRRRERGEVQVEVEELGDGFFVEQTGRDQLPIPELAELRAPDGTDGARGDGMSACRRSRCSRVPCPEKSWPSSCEPRWGLAAQDAATVQDCPSSSNVDDFSDLA